MVELGEAGGHLPAARARGRDHHQRPGGLYVVVLPVAVFADDQGHIGGIPFDGIVEVYFDALLLQLGLELLRAVLPGVVGDDHAAHIQAPALELVPQPQHVHVIGYPQIPPNLVLLDVGGADDDDYLRVVGKLHQHPQLGVRRETGKHPGRVEIVEELAAEFQVELVPELGDALLDMLGLHLQVSVIVKTDFHSAAS